MGWVYVSFAAILELVGVIGLNKFSERKTLLTHYSFRWFRRRISISLYIL